MMTTTLGAGMALVGVATLVVDLLLLYVLPQRETYSSLKYQTYGTEEEGTGDAGIDEPLLGGRGGAGGETGE